MNVWVCLLIVVLSFVLGYGVQGYDGVAVVASVLSALCSWWMGRCVFIALTRADRGEELSGMPGRVPAATWIRHTRWYSGRTWDWRWIVVSIGLGIFYLRLTLPFHTKVVNFFASEPSLDEIFESRWGLYYIFLCDSAVLYALVFLASWSYVFPPTNYTQSRIRVGTLPNDSSIHFVLDNMHYKPIARLLMGQGNRPVDLPFSMLPASGVVAQNVNYRETMVDLFAEFNNTRLSFFKLWFCWVFWVDYNHFRHVRYLYVCREMLAEVSNPLVTGPAYSNQEAVERAKLRLSGMTRNIAFNRFLEMDTMKSISHDTAYLLSKMVTFLKDSPLSPLNSQYLQK